MPPWESLWKFSVPNPGKGFTMVREDDPVQSAPALNLALRFLLPLDICSCVDVGCRVLQKYRVKHGNFLCVASHNPDSDWRNIRGQVEPDHKIWLVYSKAMDAKDSKKNVILLFMFQINKIISILISKYDINNKYNFTNITDTLRPSAISTRCHGAGPKISENFGTKNEQQRMYSSKRFHIDVSSSEISVHEISRNLKPKKFAGPQNLRKFWAKKNLRFSLIFMSRGFPCRAAFWRGAWLVLVFGPKCPKFWSKGSPKEICRRVRTLALEAIGLGLDSRLERALLSGTRVSGGTSLAGYVAGWRWLAGFVAGPLCLQLGDEAAVGGTASSVHAVRGLICTRGQGPRLYTRKAVV